MFRYLPDIRVLSSPSAECLKLALRLAHPRTEEIEFPETRGASFGVTINRVKAFMVLDKAYDIVFLCGGYEGVMMRKQLCRRLGHQDMYSTFDCIEANRKVSVCKYLLRVSDIQPL